MYISKINIENFKSFKGSFKLFLDRGINIVVGENEAGKSTIIEAIHLTLSGLLNGKYLNNELTQYIFNYEVVTEYLDNLNKGINSMPPHILIEIFIEGEDISEFEGNGNSEKTNSSGISLKKSLCKISLKGARFLSNLVETKSSNLQFNTSAN